MRLFEFDEPLFYDRQLQPLDWQEFAFLHSFRSYVRVDGARIGPLWVSTVWLGTDMSFGLSEPIVFETMVFPKTNPEAMHPELRSYVNAMMRYHTEDEALRGHASICMDIRQTLAKIDMAQEVLDEAMNRKGIE